MRPVSRNSGNDVLVLLELGEIEGFGSTDGVVSCEVEHGWDLDSVDLVLSVERS